MFVVTPGLSHLNRNPQGVTPNIREAIANFLSILYHKKPIYLLRACPKIKAKIYPKNTQI
jgi:hypothetical protein